MKTKPPPAKKHNGHDPNQIEFGIIWQLSEYPFKLRAGDIFRFEERLFYFASSGKSTRLPKNGARPYASGWVHRVHHKTITNQKEKHECSQ